jgi:CheY-like chemotaxis protein
MSGDLQRDEPETFQPETFRPETTTGLPDENAVTVAEADPAGPVVRILILEDEALGADLAQRLLVRAGLNFSVVVVDTKASFIEQLAAFRPEVILADYRLPGFSGREALKIVQAEDPDIPFIFWSGVLADEAAVELIKQGATDYVMKDRPARLPAVILRALAEAERRARLAQLKDQLMQAQSRDSLCARGAPITSSLDTVAAPQSAGASPVPRPSWPNTTRTPSGPGTQEAPATGHRQRLPAPPPLP